jgi:hypothetical protein
MNQRVPPSQSGRGEPKLPAPSSREFVLHRFAVPEIVRGRPLHPDELPHPCSDLARLPGQVQTFADRRTVRSREAIFDENHRVARFRNAVLLTLHGVHLRHDLVIGPRDAHLPGIVGLLLLLLKHPQPLGRLSHVAGSFRHRRRRLRLLALDRDRLLRLVILRHDSASEREENTPGNPVISIRAEIENSTGILAAHTL